MAHLGLVTGLYTKGSHGLPLVSSESSYRLFSSGIQPFLFFFLLNTVRQHVRRKNRLYSELIYSTHKADFDVYIHLTFPPCRINAVL